MTACGNGLSNPALERTAGSHPLAAAAHREPLGSWRLLDAFSKHCNPGGC